MKNFLRRIVVGLVVGLAVAASHAQAQLEGDQRAACEMILCLAASGVQPSACVPPIRRYFRIVASKPWKTITARLNFLRLCPVSSPDMDKLTNALAHGSGNCDANTLNVHLHVRNREEDYISNVMPEYCQIYATNPYTQIKLPMYVGTPSGGGLWADPQNYEFEVEAYNARREREKQERAEGGRR